MDIPKNVKDNLRDLGFTDYETSIYITLVTKGPLNAKDLSNLSNVPYSRIYQIIQTLIDKKFIIRDEQSRPTLYAATPPIDALKAAREQHFQDLDHKTKFLFDELNPIFLMKTIPQRLDIFLIEGRDNCLIKIEKLVNKTKKSIYISTANTEVLETLYPVLEKLRLKGLFQICLLIQNGRFEQDFRDSTLYKKYAKFGEIRSVEKVFGTVVVIDDGIEFFFMQEKNFMENKTIAGIFSEEPLLAYFIFEYYKFIYNTAQKINTAEKVLTKINIF